MILNLRLKSDSIVVDCTLGGGGHAEAILNAIGPGGRFIGIDRDEAAILKARERLGVLADRVRLVQERFEHLGSILESETIRGVDGILMDLGVSSLQLMDPDRGFSFQKDGPLDMRMDRREGRTAAELVHSLSEEDLSRILFEYGEERWARRIARGLVLARRKAPIATTRRLAELILRSVPGPARRGRIHPATRTFQALRIAVNRELEGLSGVLESAAEVLNPGGRLCVISFHSLEDRIVKQAFRSLSENGPGVFRRVTKKPIRPGPEEVGQNPRSRSAKLRVLERVGARSAEVPGRRAA